MQAILKAYPSKSLWPVKNDSDLGFTDDSRLFSDFSNLAFAIFVDESGQLPRLRPPMHPKGI